VGDADTIRVLQGDSSITLAVEIDERVPAGCVWLPAAIPATIGLGPSYGPVTIERE